MCLYKETIFPRISLRDKVVYKVLKKGYKSKDYYTPYYSENVKFNTTMYAARSWVRGIAPPMIEGEGIHAWQTFQDAHRMKISFYGDDCVVVKAIIPRGTPYYKGREGDIASAKLFITDTLCMRKDGGMKAFKSTDVSAYKVEPTKKRHKKHHKKHHKKRNKK